MLVAVLVVACVVVASLLIARGGAGPSYSGRAVDNLAAAPNSADVYQVNVPEGLPMPDGVESRLLQVGAGGPLDEAYSVDISTDSAAWLDGGMVSLNPMETANHAAVVTLTPEELAAAVGMEVSELHGDDIILVAAPVGHFANNYPQLGINDSEATIVVVKILSDL